LIIISLEILGGRVGAVIDMIIDIVRENENITVEVEAAV
jgi:hypothetical protein